MFDVEHPGVRTRLRDCWPRNVTSAELAHEGEWVAPPEAIQKIGWEIRDLKRVFTT
jgi:hypothetical protein